MITKKGTPLMERFLQKVDASWHWTGGKNKDGYGQIKVKGKQEGAHRIAYMLFKGDIPDGLFVCHTCDEPGCVNPEHLHLGTHEDNMKDRKNRNRYNGEFNGKANLKNEDVLKIRQLFSTGKISQTAIAKMFNIHQTTVSNIVLRKSWGHI